MLGLNPRWSSAPKDVSCRYRPEGHSSVCQNPPTRRPIYEINSFRRLSPAHEPIRTSVRSLSDVVVSRMAARGLRGSRRRKPLRVESRHSMRDNRYLVRFKCSHLNPHLVLAASVEIHGEHLVFLRSDGSLAALFVLEIVESWSEADSGDS
jgi:hypothetical protein